MMPPLAPNSRCAISIKNMLSNTSIVRIALYVLYIPTASCAHGLSLYLRLYDLHMEKVPAISALETKRPKNWGLVPREIHSSKSLGPGLRPVGTGRCWTLLCSKLARAPIKSPGGTGYVLSQQAPKTRASKPAFTENKLYQEHSASSHRAPVSAAKTAFFVYLPLYSLG
jgi:hypothetical protein